MGRFICRIIAVLVQLAMLFVWGAAFFYVIPHLADSLFAKVVSIVLGVFGVAPGAVGVLVAFTGLRKGASSQMPPGYVQCPHCGQPMDPALASALRHASPPPPTP
jgi:hypothetical protein